MWFAPDELRDVQLSGHGALCRGFYKTRGIQWKKIRKYAIIKQSIKAAKREGCAAVVKNGACAVLDKLCHALKAADASGRRKAVGCGDRALPVKPVKGFIKPVAGNTWQLVLFYQ